LGNFGFFGCNYKKKTLLNCGKICQNFKTTKLEEKKKEERERKKTPVQQLKNHQQFF
jgi:hypothetical protein